MTLALATILTVFVQQLQQLMAIQWISCISHFLSCIEITMKVPSPL